MWTGAGQVWTGTLWLCVGVMSSLGGHGMYSGLIEAIIVPILAAREGLCSIRSLEAVGCAMEQPFPSVCKHCVDPEGDAEPRWEALGR